MRKRNIDTTEPPTIVANTPRLKRWQEAWDKLSPQDQHKEREIWRAVRLKIIVQDDDEKNEQKQ